MAGSDAQKKWRRKNRLVKSQLNVMAPRLVHDDLAELAHEKGLRGKGEAVSFCSFVAKGLMQQAAHNPEAARIARILELAWARDRDMYG